MLRSVFKHSLRGITAQHEFSRTYRLSTILGQDSAAGFHSDSELRMPKKSKPSKGDQSSAGTSTSADNSPVQFDTRNNTVIIQILAKPGAKHNSVTDISSEGVGVHIAAPPVDGEANTELVRYMAKVLGLRKSDILLDKGSRSRNKSLVVSGGISREDVLSRLQSEVENAG